MNSLIDEVWDELGDDPSWTLAEFTKRLMLVGRNNGPALLADCWDQGVIDAGTVAAVVGQVWAMSEYPDRFLDHDSWRVLFSAAGYTVDGQRQPRPGGPLRLYRGAVPARRTDWSWTDNRKVAQRYASGKFYHRLPGVVWTALVPPDRLLARNLGRSEDEFVVDTDGLEIVASTHFAEGSS